MHRARHYSRSVSQRFLSACKDTLNCGFVKHNAEQVSSNAGMYLRSLVADGRRRWFFWVIGCTVTFLRHSSKPKEWLNLQGCTLARASVIYSSIHCCAWMFLTRQQRRCEQQVSLTIFVTLDTVLMISSSRRRLNPGCTYLCRRRSFVRARICHDKVYLVPPCSFGCTTFAILAPLIDQDSCTRGCIGISEERFCAT